MRGGRRYTRHCIPNFVDAEMFHPQDKGQCRAAFGLPAEGVLVLSVGAINRQRKRMDWLIDEFTRWGAPDAVLVIAGAWGVEGREILSQARQRLGDRFRVFENLPHERMPLLYGAADVFALCAHEEIFGIAFLEAMASGVPCIGHTYPVTEWIIGAGGSCVDMFQEGRLATELQLYSKAEVRTARGRKARERVEQMFSWNAVYPQMMEMYRACDGVADEEGTLAAGRENHESHE